jgi:hypothetical protein
MSRITFIGFLKLELKHLTKSNCLSIHGLALQAQTVQPRLAEPLLCYAMEIDAVERLLGYINSLELADEYKGVVALCGEQSIDELSPRWQEKLPWGYQKLLARWRAVAARQTSVVDSKRLRLSRIHELQEEKHISNAQIYHKLRLDKGNTNPFLKHDDVSKLSLANATKIMKYLYAL